MSISKIAFRGVEAPKEQAKSKVETKVKNEAPEVDEKMSTAAKLMIGTSAIAGVVALGIAGYKGKLGKGVQKMLGGAEKGADDLADNIRKPKGESPKAEVETPKVEQPKTETPKAGVETPKAPALKPAEEIDGSDFSKLEGEFDKFGDKVIKDADGNVVRKLRPSKDGKTLVWITDYDQNTGNLIKGTYFREDGKKVDCVIEFDPKITYKEIRTTYYKEDGTVDKIIPAE